MCYCMESSASLWNSFEVMTAARRWGDYSHHKLLPWSRFLSPAALSSRNKQRKMMPTLKISSELNGERLDVVLARAYPKYSRSFLQKVVKQGGVKLQGEIPSTSYRVRAGETYEIVDFGFPILDSTKLSIVQESIQNPKSKIQNIPEILFEDSALLVL